MQSLIALRRRVVVILNVLNFELKFKFPVFVSMLRIKETAIRKLHVSALVSHNFTIVPTYMCPYDGVRVYVGNLQSPQKTPHRSTHSTDKQTPILSQEFCVGCKLFEVTSIPHISLARGSDSESVFQWDVRIGVVLLMAKHYK